MANQIFSAYTCIVSDLFKNMFFFLFGNSFTLVESQYIILIGKCLCFGYEFFYRLVSTIELTEFSETEIADHIIKGFTAGGKVIDRDLLIGACRIFGNNIWYVNNFFFICDSLSKGYISELTFSDALSCMLSVHTPRFTRIMDNLTDYQERMLKAVLDGVIKFSTTEVLDSYRLNSSANVKRLKDALMKKEVIAFNDKDEPFLPDTLFEYWLRKYYFGETPANTLKW